MPLNCYFKTVNFLSCECHLNFLKHLGEAGEGEVMSCTEGQRAGKWGSPGSHLGLADGRACPWPPSSAACPVLSHLWPLPLLMPWPARPPLLISALQILRILQGPWLKATPLPKAFPISSESSPLGDPRPRALPSQLCPTPPARVSSAQGSPSLPTKPEGVITLTGPGEG